MTAPAIVAITIGGVELATRIREGLGDGEVHVLENKGDGDVAFAGTMEHLAGLFASGRAIIGICAAGILIRAVGPLATDKTREPPVIAVAEDGSAVVPLLGGHRGGNDLARRIAAELGVAAAITTASDAALGVAFDDPPAGYQLANPEHVRPFTARLLAGEAVKITGEAPWLDAARLNRKLDARLEIVITDEAVEGTPERLVYHPATLAVGVGAERGAAPEEAADLVRKTLEDTKLSPQSVALIASLDLKEDELAIHFVSETFSVPARFFAANTLAAETPRLANPSEAVFRAVGCHGVAEAAALAAAGPSGMLVVEKQIGRRVTCAVARAPGPIDAATTGRGRARLAVVGLGPGDVAWRSGEAARLIEEASDLVGYGRYLDLIGPPRAGQRRHAFSLGEERERVEHALRLVAAGRQVALVSSGDAGIYGMAALVFETVEAGPAEWRRIDVKVAPGISAIQAAAARAGAPIGHDFCAISLSDLMTPASVIERRVRAAAEADFVVALYNPASGRRRELLKRVLQIFRKHRPAGTPVVIARDLGREDERVDVASIGEVDADGVDMLTLVLVGSSTTRSFAGGDGRVRVYTPRGYGLDEGRRKAAS